MKKVLSALLLVPIVAMMAVSALAYTVSAPEWTEKTVVYYTDIKKGIYLNFTSSFQVKRVSPPQTVNVTITVENLLSSNGSVTLTTVLLGKAGTTPKGAEASVDNDGIPAGGQTIAAGSQYSFWVTVEITKLKGGKANVHLWVHLTEDLQGFYRPHHVGVNLICRG